MIIFMLGATGRTGQHLLAAALQANHTVHALVRDKSKVETKADNLVLFEGNPGDKAALANAMKGCGAIIFPGFFVGSRPKNFFVATKPISGMFVPGECIKPH